MRLNSGDRREKVLALVKEFPGSTAIELTSVMQIPANQMSTYLGNYCRKGYLTRKNMGGRKGYQYWIPVKQPYAPPPLASPQQPEVAILLKPKTTSVPGIAYARPAPNVAPSTKLGDVLSEVVTSITNALAEEILRQIEPVLAARLQTLAISVSTPMMHTPENTKCDAQRVKKSKLCIVGLWASQKREIEREYKDCFDLRFVGPDEAPGKLRDAAKHVDEVVVMADKISHKHTDAISTVRDSMVLIHGGLTSLRDKLTEIYISLPVLQ